MSQKRFSEFCQEIQPLDGDKVKIESILNKEILITGYRLTKSKQSENGKCLMLQFEIEDAKHIIFTGSGVLTNQIEKYNHEIPFLTTIRKINKYYTFS